MSVSRKSATSRSINKTRIERKRRNNKIIFFSIISIGVGYYILDYVAALEKPPLGATFNILFGCIIIAIATLVMIFTIKRQYFPKKRKRTNHIFLDDQMKNHSES
jgi:uncharacterized membrane protein YbhN (UPF0104 family)